MLKDKPSGSFVVRDSHSFPGAFGLALKVASLPPNVQTKTSNINLITCSFFLLASYQLLIPQKTYQANWCAISSLSPRVKALGLRAVPMSPRLAAFQHLYINTQSHQWHFRVDYLSRIPTHSANYRSIHWWIVWPMSRRQTYYRKAPPVMYSTWSLSIWNHSLDPKRSAKPSTS